MKRRISLILAFAMIFTLLTACGGGNTDTPSANTSIEVGQGTADINKPDDKPVVTDPAKTYKKELIIALDSAQNLSDPQEKGDRAHNIVYATIYNQLINYNFETREFEPELALEWKAESLDSYWFKLRQGVKFSNGEEFTADDVLFTYYDRNKGVEVLPAGASALLTQIAAVEVINDYECRIKLTAPNADFLYSLYLAYASILNRDACKADSENGFQIGTGGWIVDEFIPADHTDLVRFDGSWVWKDNPTPTEKITFRWMSEAGARSVAVQAGDIAAANIIATTDVPLLQTDPNVTTHVFAAQSLMYFLFNNKDGIVANDPNLRKAIAYAINYDDVNQVYYSGLATRHYNMWGNVQFGLTELPADLKAEYNVEKAKEFMAKSNHPNGCTLRYMTGTSQNEAKLAVLLQENLKPLGITVDVSTSDMAGITAAAKNGELDMSMLSISLRADGGRFAFICDIGHSTNRGRYDNPEMMAQFAAAAAELDDTKRLSIYKDIQETLAEEVPYLPAFLAVQATCSNAKVGGIKYVADGNYDYTHIYWEA